MTHTSASEEAMTPHMARAPDQMRPWWQAGPCPAWCYGEHNAREQYDDRIHDGAATRITTTAMDTDRDAIDGHVHISTEPAYATVHLSQHYRETEPRVWLGRGETAQGMWLTLAEARVLADRLVELVDRAQGHCA